MGHRIILTMLFAITFASAGAQTAKDIINEFKNVKGAEYVHAPRLLLSALKPFVGKSSEEAATAMKFIHSVRTLEINDCAERTRRKIQNRVAKLADNGYTEIIRSNEKGAQNIIMTLSKKDVLHELMIFNSDITKCEIVLITGKMTAEQVAKLIKGRAE